MRRLTKYLSSKPLQSQIKTKGFLKHIEVHTLPLKFHKSHQLCPSHTNETLTAYMAQSRGRKTKQMNQKQILNYQIYQDPKHLKLKLKLKAF